ncbi:MAG TPA: endonuclease/exonuclease/phosphatase family protein [Patescibacteria group bacterium]|nr:endonuclease/exonuclease/phosphatase family protein [Patescibacteria group bacterium]
MVPAAAYVYAPPNVYILLAGALLLSLAQFLKYVSFGKLHDPLETEGEPLKILQVNVLKTNQDTARLRALIAEEKPDLIVAAEVNGKFALMFSDLSRDYPHQLVEPREDRYGMAVASRLPFTAAELLCLSVKKSVAMAFGIRHAGVEISFLSLHPPTPNRNLRARDQEFDRAVKHFGPRRDSIIVLGDLNASPYCPAYKKLLRRLSLRNARDGNGLCGSFPVFLPTPLLRLPIDHVLVSANLQVHEFRLGPHIGSDHFPTITQVSVING